LIKTTTILSNFVFRFTNLELFRIKEKNMRNKNAEKKGRRDQNIILT
jgi:hypothetical protein